MEEMVRRICWFCFVGTSLVTPFLDRAIATGGQNERTRFLTLIAAVGLGAALLQSASAADLSMRPIYRGPPPAYFTWTGWYVGLNGGGGWGQTNHTATVNAAGLPPVTTNNFNTSGWLGGGTIGYNYQMGQWLVGAEADLDWSNIRGTFNGTVPVAGVGAAAFSLSSQLNWLDTTRVRVGWVWDHTLFYGTAGAAVGGVTATAAASACRRRHRRGGDRRRHADPLRLDRGRWRRIRLQQLSQRQGRIHVRQSRHPDSDQRRQREVQHQHRARRHQSAFLIAASA
jgi:outer membrane immunogenic protein